MRSIHSTLWLLFAIGLYAPCHAKSLRQKLSSLLKTHEGHVAVAIKHLATGERFEFEANRAMPTASLIKIAVMVEAYRQADAGRIDLEQRITLLAGDKVPGSGILTTHFSAGTQVSLRDAIRLMIAYSDNTATNLVLEQIGIRSTSKTMEKLGFPNTKIHAKVFRRDTSVFPDRSKRFGLGSTTALETVQLLEQLYRKQLASPSASDAMLKHLENCQDRTKLRRFLEPHITIAHKTGSLATVRTDAGIISSPSGPLVVCVLTSENKDRRWTEENAGEILCARVAKITCAHFDQGPKPTAKATLLAVGDIGETVEDLQRTLNARLKPSPDLAIDGDFGPNTQAALRQFQNERHLAVTGITDPATWKALGPLVSEDAPQPAPEIVNQEVLPKRPADSLEGPPYVTCKAWAIGDGETGQVLWQDAANQRLDIASTTKIMTAYVILKMAQNNPGLLKDNVVFSTAADKTPGSTSRIRAGESLPVGELLYALLLPSGNDAAIALAEHFGRRLLSATDIQQNTTPLSRFVTEMNRMAQDQQMHNTQFKNPHGLTEEGHLSTAHDLVKLAYAAMRLPEFQKRVACRQRGSTVTGPGGYRRNMLWKNTNRLLAIDGYRGVKTGTTTAAGACLVSMGERGSGAMFVVVLGSSSSASRYTDTRNLFRWAWQQRTRK